MMPVCSDGALAGVGRELDMISSKCMSHNYNCVSKTWLNHKDYLTADMGYKIDELDWIFIRSLYFIARRLRHENLFF